MTHLARSPGLRVGQATWRVALIAGEGQPALCPALPALVAGEGRQPLQIDRVECMIQNTGHYRLKTKKTKNACSY